LTAVTLLRNVAALVWTLVAFLLVGIAGALSLRVLSVPLASGFPLHADALCARYRAWLGEGSGVAAG
jgi:hypothetical protein